MGMGGQFGNGQGVGCLAGAKAEREKAVKMDGDPGAKIGQRKIDAAVAAVIGAEQSKQRLVLVYREQLTVAKGPSLGREGETYHPDFSDEGFCHNRLALGRKKAVQG